MEVLETLVATRGAPEHLRCDNGPELISWALRDWCRGSGSATSYIEPGSPWENPYVESFNSRIRDELLANTEFCNLIEATVLIEDWRITYNKERPHSSLGYMTPVEFYRAWTERHQPEPHPVAAMDEVPRIERRDVLGVLIHEYHPVAG